MKIVVFSVLLMFLIVVSNGFCIDGVEIEYSKNENNGKIDRFLKKYASDPYSPIKYNKYKNTYYIEYDTVSNGEESHVKIPIHYCPITGERLTYPQKQ
ncbi:MAG: hypothetical protein V1747_05575 [Candidatus Omnitrophota bacterium]